MAENVSRPGWFGIKGLVAFVVGALGVGALFYGSGIGTETSKRSSLPGPEIQNQKPVRAINLALGPMVFLAQDLGFAVTNAKGEKVDGSRIAARVENQLQGLRSLYRGEIVKNPKLVGGLVLQFSVNAAGQVTQVKEMNSRLNDVEFKQIVASETGKWSFAEIVTEPSTVQLPLLFVEEGMDISTLVRWESSLAGAREKVANAPAVRPEISQQAKAAATVVAVAKSAAARGKAVPAIAISEGDEVQIKYATPLRKEPNFNSPGLTTFTIGTKVLVVTRRSDWLEVRSQQNGPTGYIRKEFVILPDAVASR